jgi:hypothetical protein
MLRVVAGKNRLCDGISRRDLLSIGALGAFSLMGRAASASPQNALPGFGRAKRCLLLFLTGGPPQHETWDMKPRAPTEIRGELKPIESRVPGIQICELFPKLSQLTDKLCIVRSITHADTVHTSAGYTMLTGVVHPKANSPSATSIQPTPDDFPHLGAVLTKQRGARELVPTAVSLPEYIRDAGVNDFPGQDAGFLGKAYSPLLIEANSEQQIQLPALILPRDISPQRLEDRNLLRQQLNGLMRSTESSPLPANDLAVWQSRALTLLQSPLFRSAFEVEREPETLRQSYGQHLFGKGCLLARRLLEAGVSLVTVYWHYEGPEDSPVWDSHWNHFKHLRERLMPPTDQAFSTLLTDLDQRGLLADTLVVCLGEFGRTPKINKMAGRDHWPHVQSIVMAGAGMPGGTIYGSSDSHGAYPLDSPVTPADLSATILHLLGVPTNFSFQDRAGRPFAAYHGSPVAGLLTGCL